MAAEDAETQEYVLWRIALITERLFVTGRAHLAEARETEAGETVRITNIVLTNNGESMKSDYEVNRALNKYADTVRRICLLHLKNYADTEDIFQTVFLKYFLHNGTFESDEHEKAWIIRVTINACKDFLKSFYRKNVVPIEAVQDAAVTVDSEQSAVLEAVLALPKKYKDAVYLFYYEGYSALEISKILNKKENTVYTLLARGRTLLRKNLGGEDLE